MDAYNASFLVQTNGQSFYTWDFRSNTVDHVQGSWGQAFDIYPLEDHAEFTRNIADVNLVNATMNSWLTSPSWAPNGGYWDTVGPANADGWNDNIGWTLEAIMRAYQITGNSAFLTQAENGWNFVMSNRNGAGGGLNPTYGGIPETSDPGAGACALSNSNFIYTGVWLYEATGNGNYLSGSESLYAWMRQHFVNTTGNTITNSAGTWRPWQVIGCLSDPQGTVQHYGDDNVYDSGGVAWAATELYRVTGNQQYLSDATNLIIHIVAEYNPTANPTHALTYNQEDCACVDAYHFTKALSEYLTVTNGWWSSPNATWLLNNAQVAWNNRDGYNLTWNEWNKPTTDPAPQSMETVSAVGIWQHLPVPEMNLAGTYEIRNAGSGLGLNVPGSNATPGTGIIQYPFSNGETNSLWTFVPTSGGYYQIKNASTGLVLNVSGASGQPGATVVEWPAQSVIPGNDQWMPVQNSDGTFSFYNLLSRQALDIQGGSTASNAIVDQYFENGTAAQKFNLIQPSLSLSGTYEIRNANSGLALNVSGGSTANNAAIIQWPFSSGQTNAEWRFVPANPGYYRIQNVNSGLYINVTGGSTAFGALLIQWGASATNNDQWRVVENSDGTYSFYNGLSTLAIDVPAGSTASNVQLEQWGENTTGAQRFNLISQ